MFSEFRVTNTLPSHSACLMPRSRSFAARGSRARPPAGWTRRKPARRVRAPRSTAPMVAAQSVSIAPSNTRVINSTRTGRVTRCVRVQKTLLNWSTLGTIGTPAFLGNTINPAINVMPDYANLSALWSKYRIDKLIFTFTCKEFTSSTTTTGVKRNRLWFTYNYNPDVAVPTTAAMMENYDDVKCHTFSEENPTVTMVVYPKIMVPTLITAAPTFGYVMRKPGWTENTYLNSDQVLHWGLLYGLEFNGYDQVAVDIQYCASFARGN